MLKLADQPWKPTTKPGDDPADRAPHANLGELVVVGDVGEGDRVAQAQRGHVAQQVAEEDPHEPMSPSPASAKPGAIHSRPPPTSIEQRPSRFARRRSGRRSAPGTAAR